MSKPTTIDEIIEMIIRLGRHYAGEEASYIDGRFKDRQEAKQQLLDLLESKVIGEDEKHYNGVKMVNEPDPEDWSLYERWSRNQLRQTQRLALRELGDK